MGKGYCDRRGTKTKGRTIIVPNAESDNERWCPSCEQYLNINSFYGDITRGSSLACYCKVCDNEKRMNRYTIIKEAEENEKN